MPNPLDPFWPVKDAGSPFNTGFVNGWIKGSAIGLPIFILALVVRHV